jgi:hypothetical protein
MNRTANSGASARRDTRISSNESDTNWEAANVVDGLFAIARALQVIGGALEVHAAEVANLASAVREREKVR